MADSNCIEIHWTSGSIDEARKICRFLVQERLVACAQIVPWVESIYMWDNQMETTQESKVFLKTRRVHFDAVKKIIIENNQYAIPEVLFFSIEGGSDAFLQWLNESAPECAEKPINQ